MYGATLLAAILASPFPEVNHVAYLVLLLFGFYLKVAESNTPNNHRWIIIGGLAIVYGYFCLPYLSELLSLDARR